jgi:urease accessory protein
MRIQLSTASVLMAACTALAAATPALAHDGHDHVPTFAAGFVHPLGGLDHLLAMVGIGIWASQQQDMQRRVLVPVLFVAGVVAGAVLGLQGLVWPFVEATILASLAVIAGLILTRTRPDPVLAAVLVVLLALGHGMAHGLEAPASGSLSGYIAGFSLATALLHAGGLVGGLAVWRLLLRGRAVA